MSKYENYLLEFEKNVDIHIDETIKEIKEFATKNNVKRFVIGMSGGIDCALSSALVKKAGYEVIALTMPYEENTSKQRVKGISDAKKHCEAINIPLYEVSITNMVNSMLKEQDKIKNEFSKYNGNERLAKANILPRARMINVYYVAQLINGVVLGTGNLSEYTMGYFTKWGDGGYDYDPILKYTKTEVYILAKRLNIIEEIINKKPSADLWDGQTDEEEMNISYSEIDKYIRFPEECNENTKLIVENAKRRSAHKKQNSRVLH